jgi:hypothetical protein
MIWHESRALSRKGQEQPYFLRAGGSSNPQPPCDYGYAMLDMVWIRKAQSDMQMSRG